MRKLVRLLLQELLPKLLLVLLPESPLDMAVLKLLMPFTKLPHEIKPNMKFKNLRRLFIPSDVVLESLNQYKKLFGTIISIAIMVVTNFLIDAPLTKF